MTVVKPKGQEILAKGSVMLNEDASLRTDSGAVPDPESTVKISAVPLSEASEPLSAYCLALAVPLCREHRCLIGELFRGGKCKLRNVAQARMRLVVALRRSVGMRNNGGKTFVQVFGDSGVPYELGWAPLSTPLIGRLIGFDHSSVIAAMNRARKQGVVECPA